MKIMTKALPLLLALLASSLLTAQKVTNVRVSQDPELRYYKISFDLGGQVDKLYQIEAVPYKADRELAGLRYLVGAGITEPCPAGKDLQIFWEPIMEGFESEGWQFRITAKALPKNMAWIEGGTFQMGSNDGKSYEKPVHPVILSSYWIGKYEVSQKEWTEVMGSNPSYFKGDDLPVEKVSWYDAVDYCNKRSQREGLSPCYSGKGDNIVCDWNANGYRLPTEAEWEYAPRGGKESKAYKYSGSNDIKIVAWYDKNSGSKTHEVGTKAANELGLYDKSGNVWEWCWDWYDRGYYAKSPGSDPKGAGSGSSRVLRGGSWLDRGNDCRVACRFSINPGNRLYSIGFRVARAIF